MALAVYKETESISKGLLNFLSEKAPPNFKLKQLNNLEKSTTIPEDIVVLDPENMKESDYKTLRTSGKIINLWSVKKLKNFLINPENEIPSLNLKKTVDIVYASDLEPTRVIEEGVINLLNAKDHGYVVYLDKNEKMATTNKLLLINNFISLLTKRFPQMKQLDKISRTIMMAKFFMDNFPNSQVDILEKLGKICAELALLRYKVQTGEITLGTDGETSLSEITVELERIHEYLDRIFEDLFDNMFFTFMSQFVSSPQLESNLVGDFLKFFTSMSSKVDAASKNFRILKTGKYNLKKLIKQLQVSHKEKKETMKNYRSLYKKNLRIFKIHPSTINRSLIDEFAGLVIFLEGLRKTIENQLELMNVFSNVPKIVWGIGELSELIFVDLKFLISKLRKLYQASPTFVQVRGDIVLNKFDGPGGLIEKWGTAVKVFREYNQRYSGENIKDILTSISRILGAFHQNILETLQYFQRDITIMNITEYTIQTSDLILRISSQKIDISQQEMRRLHKELTLHIIMIFKKLMILISENREISKQKNARILAAWEYIKEKVKVGSKEERRKKLVKTFEIITILFLIAILMYLTTGDFWIPKFKEFLMNLLSYLR